MYVDKEGRRRGDERKREGGRERATRGRGEEWEKERLTQKQRDIERHRET